MPPAAAYEAEGHYAWTYYLALHVGFTRAQAFQIASAAYALDEDPQTGPMEASTGDPIFGAEHPGLRGLGDSHPEIARIWTAYHAFADQALTRNTCTLWDPGLEALARENAVFDLMRQEVSPSIVSALPGCAEAVRRQVEGLRRIEKRNLWNLATRQANPGPAIHFSQDYYSHFDYDSVRGHALAGHSPDFLATDPENKAKSASRDTVDLLQRFMNEVICRGFGGPNNPCPQRPRSPDWERMWQVLGQLIAANPAPEFLSVGNFNPGTNAAFRALPYNAPKTRVAVDVIRKAIEEDEAAGRLPRFPEYVDDDLPAEFTRFDYESSGEVSDPAYPVVPFAFKVQEPELEFEPVDRANTKVWLRIRYSVAGQPKIASRMGPYLHELPLIERFYISDARDLERRREHDRDNGEYLFEEWIQRPNRDIEAGTLRWMVTLHPYGLDPIELDIPIIRDRRITTLGPAAATVDATDAGTALDLIFAFDLTSSMGSSIDSMKERAVDLVRRVAAKTSDYRVGLVAFRDAESEDEGAPAFAVTPLRKMSAGDLESTIAPWNAAGGGDTPEDSAEALSRAIAMWEAEGTTARKPVKLIVLITDAPGKWPDSFGNTRESIAQRAFAVDPAHVYPIVVGGSSDAIADAELIAESTGGRVTRAEDGADVADAVLAAVDEGFTRHATGAAPGGGGPVLRRRASGDSGLIWIVGLLLLANVAVVGLMVARRSGRLAPAAPAGQAIELELEVSEPGAMARRVRISAAPAILGRDPRCAVVLADPAASREHARVEIVDGRLVLRDLGSQAGVRLKGGRRQTVELRRGLVVMIGGTRVEVL